MKQIGIHSALDMASSDSQIDKPQHGRSKRAELPNVNINTGAQTINSERAHRCDRLDELKFFTGLGFIVSLTI